uniref:Poly(A) polymerase catalytic subunit domain-containing protein n=1 Tax=viral metagenome TaxID=1070528 RepID=A0A6C0D566_9ZZZZ
MRQNRYTRRKLYKPYKEKVKRFRQSVRKQRYDSDLCNNKMTFQDCEMAILRHAVDESEAIKGKNVVDNEDIKKILKIVESFIYKKKVICYGGTAINNILPKEAQFYNKDIEIPDYDFFSKHALHDAKELADIYYKAGYKDVEAKSGVHHGTYKVFVNFIPIADITYLVPELFDAIYKDAITIAGVHYAPPNYLRMSMYLELSRPAGDVSRWEKVLKRINLLNRYYPLSVMKECHKVDFQRKLETVSDINDHEHLYYIVRDKLIDQGVIFFGAYATTLYSKYMPVEQKHLLSKEPDFDVIHEDPDRCALIVKEALEREKFSHVKLINHEPIGEIIPESVELRIGNDTIAFIFKPIACHSYNKLRLEGKEIYVATIDTILSFYLSFLYTDMHYFDKDRLMCMAKFLFDVQERNRLAQKGLLKRFTSACVGKQPTMEEMRAEKAQKYKDLDRNSEEYEEWFLKYVPADKKGKRTVKKVKNDQKNEESEEKSDKKNQKNGFFGLW